MRDQIATALLTLRRLRNESDAAIHALLVTKGIEPRIAARLVELLPVAYGRALLSRLGLQFSDDFQRRLPDGQLTQRRSLHSEPLWNDVVTFCGGETASTISRDDLLAVAGRSAEFDAANKLLMQGSAPRDIRFTPVVFIWPEEGPT